MEEKQEEPLSSQEHLHSDFFTVDEISKVFDQVQQRCLRYDEECTEEGIGPYIKTIADLNKIQQSIIHHSLISINEDLEEIHTENLKCFFQTDKKTWKNLSYDNNYQLTRDEKISSYKEQKSFENKLNNLEKIKDEKDRREILITQINICIYKSIDLLRSNVQEIEILEYKEKIQNDPKAKEQHEKLMNKPIPKPSITKISNPDDKSTPFMFEQNKGKVSYLCHRCAQTKEEKRHELRQQVFTPGTTMPTVTLDQLADLEIENMKKNEESTKYAQKKQQEQDDADSDRDSVGDAKQDEARRWDDWKDMNEKGAGNRFGK